MARAFDLSGLAAAKEHQAASKYLQGELEGLDHPEALRALGKVFALTRMLASALWDGVQGEEPGRVMQGQIDATVMADFGSAIERHINGHR